MVQLGRKCSIRGVHQSAAKQRATGLLRAGRDHVGFRCVTGICLTFFILSRRATNCDTLTFDVSRCKRDMYVAFRGGVGVLFYFMGSGVGLRCVTGVYTL